MSLIHDLSNLEFQPRHLYFTYRERLPLIAVCGESLLPPYDLNFGPLSWGLGELTHRGKVLIFLVPPSNTVWSSRKQFFLPQRGRSE